MKKHKAYGRMNADELAKATAEFDEERVHAPGRPATAAERRKFNGIRRKLGRPKVGQGSQLVPVTIERGLLKEADRFAKQHKLKRSQMVAQGLRLVMEQRAKAG
jgi:hypothetical protein